MGKKKAKSKAKAKQAAVVTGTEGNEVVLKDSIKAWKTLAEFLGIDSDSDPDAMQDVTYFTCLKILRENVAKMPFKVIKIDDRNGVEDMIEHPFYDVLFTRPNPYVPPTFFWAGVEQARNHYGNAYVWLKGSGIEKDPYSLWYMHPEEVEVYYDLANPVDELPDIYYFWSTGGQMRVFKSREVMHFRSSDTVDGIMGIPLIDRLGATIKGGIKSQEFQNDLISSGMTGKAVLQYAGEIDPEKEKRFREHIQAYIKGDDKKYGNVVPIPVGSSLTPLNLKLTDSQFKELKEYNAIQIAAAFGIQPQQIGDMTKTSYASAQAQNENFFTSTLLYIKMHYEQETTFKAISKEDRKNNVKCVMDSSEILMSSWSDEVEAAVKAVQGSVATPNEVRRDRLNLPAKDGGDELFVNGSYLPIDMAGIQYTDGAPTPSDDGGGGEEQ